MTGPELKALRKRMSITQAELAEQLDVRLNTVSRWELGRRPIDRRTELAILSLANAPSPCET